jgi:hypothetical protein
MSFTQYNNNTTDYTENKLINQSTDNNPQIVQHDSSQFRKGKSKQRLPEVDPK